MAGSRLSFSDAQKKHADFNFASLQDAYDRLHARMILVPAIGNFPKAANYIATMEFLDELGNYQPVTSIIVW